MTEREKRKQRKVWRDEWKRRVENKEKTQPKVCSTTSDSSTKPHRELQCLKNTLKKQKDLRGEMTEKITVLEEIIRKKQTTIERLKKRETRAKKSTQSPASKAKYILKHGTQKQVMRRLLFSETMARSLEDGYKALSSNEEKNRFSKLIVNSFLYFKKYKLMTDLNFISSKIFHMNFEHRLNKSHFRMKLKKLKAQVKADVIDFFEDEEQSRPCPGKRDFMVRKKDKRQKRFLSASLKCLHENFCESRGYRISYSTFCKLKPFWVVHRKITERDTCGCKSHENKELLVRALHSANTIQAKSVGELLNDLCCDSSATSCLLRNCQTCLNKVIMYDEFDSNEPVTYLQWNQVKNTVTLKNKQRKTVTHVAKEVVQSTKGQAVDILESQIVKFMNHQAIMIHQARQFKLLKMNLTEKDFVIHCDFSENYAAKLNTEIQSFHFGGSRKQFTLHTVQVYYKHDAYSALKSQSICSLSEVNEHGPSAVFAHLQPVLEFLFKNAPNVENVHFQYDCLATQYRNKTIFYLITHVFSEMRQIKSVTWNYSAPGHGKGAPDGVGGCLKRTADRVVAEGCDINNFTDFVETLRTHTRSIILHIIQQEDIDRFSKQIPGALPAFKGTMKVHQVVFEQSTPGVLRMKSLSCPSCLSCDEHLIGEFKTLKSVKHNSSSDFGQPPLVEGSSNDGTPFHPPPNADSESDKLRAKIGSNPHQYNNLPQPQVNSDIRLVGKFALAVNAAASSSKSATTKICHIAGTSKSSKDDFLVYWLQPLNESRRIFTIDTRSGVQELMKKHLVKILPSPTIMVVGKKLVRAFFPS